MLVKSKSLYSFFESSINISDVITVLAIITFVHCGECVQDNRLLKENLCCNNLFFSFLSKLRCIKYRIYYKIVFDSRDTFIMQYMVGYAVRKIDDRTESHFQLTRVHLRSDR